MKKKLRAIPVHYRIDAPSFLALKNEVLLPEFNNNLPVSVSNTLLKVLVVDTDAYVIRTLHEVLDYTSKVYFLNDILKVNFFIERHGINFIIIDPTTLNIPYYTFFEFIKELKEMYPDIGLMVLTSLRDKLLLQLLRTFRSFSIVSKYESMQYIEKSINKFFNGNFLTSEYILDLLHDYEKPVVLSHMEWEVLKLHAKLSTPAQIALTLGQSINIIYYRIKRIILKLRIGNRYQYLNLLAKLQLNPVLI